MDKNNAFYEEYGEVVLPASDKIITSEMSGDFSLPDYQPEIKRLLRVTASMLPPSKYFGAGEAEFAGNIDYYVLYMGSDNEVYCAPLTGEYNVHMPIDKEDYIDLGDELVTVAQITPELVSGRVTSPRHITVKCRLKTHARIYGTGKVIGTITKCDGSIEKLKSEVQNADVILGAGEMLTLTDEMIPDARDGEFRVVCADGRVLVSEVSAGKDEVICRGELYLKMIMSRENGTLPTVTVRRMPFSSIVAAEGVTPDSSAYAKGSLAELTLTVDEGRILTEAGVLLETVCQKNRPVEYISDMYSVTNESECVYRELTVPKGISGFNRNFTFSESMTLSEAGIGENMSVMDACGVAVLDEFRFEGGKCKMLGKCRFNLQLFDGSDYSGAEIEMPFKYEYDMPEAVEDAEVEAEAGVVSCRARVDGERVGIDAEISLCGRVWENIKCLALESYRLGEELSARSGEICVCYPAKGDTLWDIAKKYNAPLNVVSEANKLMQNVKADSVQSLEGTEYLVI